MKDKDFYRGKGCPHCFNTGYSGRIAIAEILLMTQKIRELVLSGAQEHLIKQQACQEGMMTLRQAGLQAAANSLTSLEEVLRLTAADE
jgi:type IV pilus assembly protein PilB